MILQKATIVEWRAVFRKENRSCKSKLVLFLCQPDSYKLWVSLDVLLWASSLFAIATSVIKSWKLIVIRAKVVGQLQVARDGRRANAGQIILGRWGGARGNYLIWSPTSRSASGRAWRMLVSKEAQRTRVAKWATRRGQRWDMAALIRYKLYPT